MLKQYIMLMSVALWSGCIMAISFMESWLKFRAPGVSLTVGLNIGKLVFNALNNMEWVFAMVALICYISSRKQMKLPVIILLGTTVLLLLTQTFWLLPALGARADALISGKTLSGSPVHWIFIIAEVIKLILLLTLSFRLYKGSYKIRPSFIEGNYNQEIPFLANITRDTINKDETN